MTHQSQQEKPTTKEEEKAKQNLTLKKKGGISTLSAPKHWHNHPTLASQNNSRILNQTNDKISSVQFNPAFRSSRKENPFSCFALDASRESMPPLVVVGSANADIYVEIDRLPKEGETISAKTGQTLAGGKGANQAVCGGKLAYPTYFLGQVGDDAHGKLITEALEGGGVFLDYLSRLDDVPSGHAVVMLQAGGQNSIIIVGGANMACWPETLPEEDLEVVKYAGIVLLQREIPDSVNIQVAKVARNAHVPVILDAGGVDAPIPIELLSFVDILSPNETELARLTNMPTETFEQISQAVKKCYKMGVKQVLVKLGDKGSVLFTEGAEPIKQPIISASKVIDTTGAGDTFTASFAVALVEGKSRKECLRFAAAAASLCIQVKGAIPSMPDRKSVLDLLHSL
ncbi:probable ribokinase [Olea europaea subsp. europaea]|uniref:Ribokinase n=1 Tax=Olea europaea subsp. europaea TaxID=158383 RepID=A0A8S0U0C5_OLEEU|nr:probable ribokinase [Olea europaea subsp. europaea]